MRTSVITGLAEMVRLLRIALASGPLGTKAEWAKPLAQRASELPGVPLLTAFVDRELQDRELVPRPSAIVVAGVWQEMPATRKTSAAGGRSGAAAVALDAHGDARQIGWSGISVKHARDGTVPPPPLTDEPPDDGLSPLLDALARAQPGVPIIVDRLPFPTPGTSVSRPEASCPSPSRYIVAAGFPVIFPCEAPESTAHFADITKVGDTQGVFLRERVAGRERTIQMRRPSGKTHYYRAGADLPAADVVRAILTRHGSRDELSETVASLQDSKILVGNVQAIPAVAVRVTGWQVERLCSLGGVPDA